MPGFGDSAFIVILALLLFGPKKLPVLARQLGKLMADFRRASNEFRAQMEEELRISEQADRQKEVAALEAASANKIEPPIEPHTPPPAPNFATPTDGEAAALPEAAAEDTRYPETSAVVDSHVTTPSAEGPATAPTPIATSGELNMMPPETGLPIARPPRSAPAENGQATDLPPTDEAASHETELETEPLHG